MRAVLVGIPILKDARRFHVRKGRRWTIFEHIILEAVAKRDWSISELVEASDLPRRVVIEILIRLMRAGWVELTPKLDSIIFAATSHGRLYASQAELPPVTRPDARFISYTADLLTGSIFRIRDLAHATNDQWRKRAKGRPSVLMPDPGGRQDALPDVRRLADTLLEPDEELIRIDVQDWRPRRRIGIVSVRGEEIEGLGGNPAKALRLAVLDAARTVDSRSSASAPDAGPSPRPVLRPTAPRRAITYRSEDLLLGAQAHATTFDQMLARAHSRLIIHSTFINEAAGRETIEKLKPAVRRGALIDILWGKSTEKDEVNETRKAAFDLDVWLQQQGFADRIRIHQVSTRSHAKILFGDVTSQGGFSAVVGSCNWMSSGFTSFDASVRLRDPGIVADVAFELAELVRPADGQIPDLTAELARIGRRLELETKPVLSGRPFAQVALGAEHARLLLEARDEAKTRMLVTSHRLGANAKPVLKPLVAAAHANGVAPEVYYGRVTGKVTGAVAAGAIIQGREEGIEIRAILRPRLHAKVLAWDQDDAVITSLNWLSADPSEADPRREIGVRLHGPGVAHRVWEAFAVSREFAGT